MRIGVPKEIMDQEGRVSITPGAVRLIRGAGHNVSVEAGAGVKSGFSDREYAENGAEIASGEAEVWRGSDMVLKVKQPLPEEYRYFRPGLIVFTFFHFSANRELERICESEGIIPIPYETVRDASGSRPILRAMSRIAGEVAADAGAHYLREENGGLGILLKDVTVSILGACGSAGRRSYEVLSPRVKSIFAIDIAGDPLFGNSFLASSAEHIALALRQSHLVICAAVIPGKGAPRLVTRGMAASMPKGSVLVDIAIDEGGNSETSRATHLSCPTYVDEGVIHFCAPNIPGSVPHSSSRALVEASLPYILAVANGGGHQPDLAS